MVSALALLVIFMSNLWMIFMKCWSKTGLYYFVHKFDKSGHSDTQLQKIASESEKETNQIEYSKASRDLGYIQFKNTFI